MAPKTRGLILNMKALGGEEEAHGEGDEGVMSPDMVAVVAWLVHDVTHMMNFLNRKTGHPQSSWAMKGVVDIEDVVDMQGVVDEVGPLVGVDVMPQQDMGMKVAKLWQPTSKKSKCNGTI